MTVGSGDRNRVGFGGGRGGLGNSSAGDSGPSRAAGGVRVGVEDERTQAPEPANTRRAPAVEGDGTDAGALLPSVSLPRGGGALRGIGEKLAVNAATGAVNLSVPIGVSPGRGGFGPDLALSYSAGAGNGAYGVGWALSPPSISRRTEKGLPRYVDAEESDVFVLAGAEDLVPALDANQQIDEALDSSGAYLVRRYRPRVEAGFSRIERWTELSTADVHWRVTSSDNIMRVYGRGPATRVADPARPERVFSWLLEETRDDRGNVTLFDYVAEDGAGVDPHHPAERARFEWTSSASPSFTATAQRYLKRIRYGNRTPSVAGDFMFQVVLDYGDHQDPIPTPTPDSSWTLRDDPFSSHRSGFEVRTYRLCRRFLMFHEFPELGPEPDLVWSTVLDYADSSVVTKLRAITQVGYARQSDGTYATEPLPPLEFDYTSAGLNTELRFLSEESLAGISGGIDGAKAQWADLNGEGIPGVVLSTQGAMFFKANRGAGELGAPLALREAPSGAELASGRLQLTDLDGDSRLELVAFSADGVGTTPRTDEGTWATFHALPAAPNLDWNDPNLRFVDLDGDGRADVLISEHDCFVWYRSLGRDGYAAPETLSKANDEGRGPKVVFQNTAETIQLTDMSGDGLMDIVRVRNGEVCYWPNLGYGRFGKKITLADSPNFAEPDSFDPARVRFADIDGSGTSDVAYVGRTGITIWLNQAGNALGPAQYVTDLPSLDLASRVTFTDLFGNGTATLVWSSPWREGAQPIGYVDLMGGIKPHLLRGIKNNLGAETRMTHRSSVHFYLEDQANGRPWLTRLPFPVHVVERVEHFDHVGQTRLLQRYAYHHGYHDGIEQEFRGFAMVEQFDAEVVGAQQGAGLFPDAPAPERNLPPIHTKTWFHTGAFLGKERLERELAKEYFADDPDAPLLPDTILPTGLRPSEQREATRALRGRVLRQEIYADDDAPEASFPYAVTEASFVVRREQAARGKVNGVFFVHPQNAITLNYERNPQDPRTTQDLVIEVDTHGNVLKSASIAYPRRNVPTPNPGAGIPDLSEQGRLWATYNESKFAEQIDAETYRHSVNYEAQVWEITGLSTPNPQTPYTGDQVETAFGAASEIPFEAVASPGVLERRLVEHQRRFFYDDNLTEDESSGTLPLGQIGQRALLRRAEALAFTPGLLSGPLEGRPAQATLTGDGGYRLDAGNYWSHSGRAIYDPARFYQAVESVDPFGARFSVDFDVHDLLVVRTEDPLQNVVLAQNDYRVLRPWERTDPNGNRVQLAYDVLQRVERMAVLGKVSEALGDTLQDPTQRFEYFLDTFQADGTPVHVRTFAREEHGPSNTRFLESVSFSDGFGREVLRKVQAEPGLAPLREPDGSLQRNPDGTPIQGVVSPRWVGTGRVIFDNKGNPIKQYEPFFSSTDGFETEDDLVQFGVTPILHYDPLGRLIRSQNPDGSESRVEFDNWFQSAFDPNDSVRDQSGADTPWLAARLDPSAPAEDQRAAQLTLAHLNTPSVTHLDSLGRPFLAVADNAAEGRYETRSVLDVEGNVTAMIDARGITTLTQAFDVRGRRIRIDSPDAGKRLTLPDVVNAPVRAWDGRQQSFRTAYDALRRPAEVFVAQGANPEQLVQKTVYGEVHPAAMAGNLRGRAYQVYDGAGVVTSTQFDFKGNLMDTNRRLTTGFQVTTNWSALGGLSDITAIEAAASAQLELQSYPNHAEFDALNRVTLQTGPDDSTTRPEYSEASLLQALHASVKGGPEELVVTNIDYNARGQRTLVEYANGTKTQLSYDPLTFRVVEVLTTNAAETLKFQDLSYTYDPVGNVVDQRDRADFSPIFTNQPIQADGQYVYDAIYRLSEARGREHPGQQAIPDDPPKGAVPHVNDVVGRLIAYTESYSYDAVGNIQQMVHNANGAGWTRNYQYATDSNRLLRTSVPGNSSQFIDYAYSDTGINNAGAHGSMTAMPHLSDIEWDYADRMRHANLIGGGDVYFTYDAAGQRVRKVYVHSGRVDERIYLGAFEIYREHTTGSLTGPIQLERETLHISDDARRVAMVETKTIDTTGGPGTIDQHEWRFQLDNHLGSSMLELDRTSAVISYEEYHPFGSTAFHTANGSLGVSSKRYRYTGKEKDDETGLYYHGARYYAPWLGRWTAADPLGTVDGLNLYRYARNKPVRLSDPGGTQSEDWVDDGVITEEVVAAAERFWEAKLESGAFANVEPDYGVQWSEGPIRREYAGPTPVAESRSNNRLTTDPDERSLYNNFPEHRKAGGIGNENYRDLIEGAVRDELAKVGVTDERIIELVVAQSTQETDAGRSYFNFNPGGVRASTNRPHVYVGGGSEELRTRKAADALVARNSKARLTNPEGPPPYVVKFARSASNLSRFAAYDSVEEGIEGYVHDTAIADPTKAGGAAQTTQAYIAEREAKGETVTLKDYSEYYARRLLEGGYYTAGGANGRKATEAEKRKAAAGYARAIRNRLNQQYPDRAAPP